MTAAVATRMEPQPQVAGPVWPEGVARDVVVAELRRVVDMHREDPAVCVYAGGRCQDCVDACREEPDGTRVWSRHCSRYWHAMRFLAAAGL